MDFTSSETDCAGDIASFALISGVGWVWFWSCRDCVKTGGLLSFSAWCGSLIWLLECGGCSRVDRRGRRFLRKRQTSTSTSYDRLLRGRPQWPMVHFCSYSSFMRMASTVFCFHCNLFQSARLLALLVLSPFGRTSFSAVGSKVRVCRPISLWADQMLNPSLGVLCQSKVAY